MAKRAPIPPANRAAACVAVAAAFDEDGLDDVVLIGPVVDVVVPD